ncbi:MAG: response regulator transcription factor [Clostridium sp.]
MLDILIVEDEAPIRKWIEYTIVNASSDFNVIGTANNGKEGYDLALQLKPKVILTDIKMPVMDGIELTKKIKEELPDTVVIILTNFEEFSYAKQAITYGVYEYLIKSDIRTKDIKELLDKINNEIKIADEKLQKAISVEEHQNFNFIGEKEVQVEHNKDYSKYSKSIQSAMEYIEKNYKDHISLGDISKHVYLSHEYFSRLFKEEVGENFVTYLSRYRIKEARKLIKNRDKKISQIAVEVGYTNPGYFSKTYKKYLGVSPEDDR